MLFWYDKNGRDGRPRLSEDSFESEMFKMKKYSVGSLIQHLLISNVMGVILKKDKMKTLIYWNDIGFSEATNQSLMLFRVIGP